MKEFDGKLLNGPNDVWVRPDGGVYFSDPFLKRPYWTRGPAEQGGAYIYFLSADRKTLKRVTGAIGPNGVVGTPDGKTLYVASGGIKAYDIQDDGSLTNERKHCDGRADGMTLDVHGRIYLAAKGVVIYDQTGALVETIQVPEKWNAIYYRKHWALFDKNACKRRASVSRTVLAETLRNNINVL